MDVPELLRIPFESFERNARVNRLTLATITSADLPYSDGFGGFSIGQHLADCILFRPGWLREVAPRYVGTLEDLYEPDSPTWLASDDIDTLQAAFEAGDAAVKAAVLEAVADGRTFENAYRSHPVHFIQHCIVHDSHHRGQVLALLRQAGRSKEEREALEGPSWAVWRE